MGVTSTWADADGDGETGDGVVRVGVGVGDGCVPRENLAICTSVLARSSYSRRASSIRFRYRSRSALLIEVCWSSPSRRERSAAIGLMQVIPSRIRALESRLMT